MRARGVPPSAAAAWRRWPWKKPTVYWRSPRRTSSRWTRRSSAWSEINPRLARVVECRYFAGYTEAETAIALQVTERTVQRDWVKAKALLYQALGTD